MANLCNLNGSILPETEASVPVLDRGFLFGDSVYEVICTRRGIPFAAIEHLDRMRLSAAGLGIDLDLDDDQILARIKATLVAAANPESYVRIIVTRGTGTAPNIDLAHAPGPLTWVLLVRDLAVKPGQPSHLAIVPRLRNDRRALDPAIKSGNYLNNVLGLAEAKRRGATECLFLNAAGFATEASTSNFFCVDDGILLTPPSTAGLLKGITRSLLFDCCAKHGFEVVEKDITEREVRDADELFLSGTTKDVAPVTHLDGQPVGDGTAGPVTRRLMETFADYCEERLRSIDQPRFERISPDGS